MNLSAGIRLDAVCRHYETQAGVVKAIEGASFEVERGSSLAITGPSGSGKSTLLAVMAGMERPTSGRILVGGRDIARLPESGRTQLRRRQFGLVFQQDNLLPFLTALENVALQLALRNTDEGYERCLEVLVEVGLGKQIDKLPDQLSGGERQRVAVARALIGRPWLILADEPTGSLDGHNSAAVVDLLLAAQRQGDATLVVVTHDVDVARRLDRTLHLRDGRLADGAARSGLPEARPPGRDEARANAS
jgi:putative ABC transport system ATP-binding protein